MLKHYLLPKKDKETFVQILSSSRVRFVLNNLAIENFDAAGFLIGYSLRSDINLVFATDALEDQTEPTGKCTISI